MPATYSINDNTVYEATRFPSISDALNLLPDNTTKLITPRDARDAVFTAWESSVFKQTTGSASIEYIGIDRDDIRQKFLIGKKRLGGIDVLNSTLLNYNTNDSDIFFFNNKPGFLTSNTKISFLAGTNSILYPLAPYFEAYSSTSSTINFDIVNNTGDIIVDSLVGRVSVNNVIFPTKMQTASASNGDVLKYYNGSLIWGANTIILANIGSTSSVTNIIGSPVLINGYNMELVDSNPIIATFGHIPIGQTFSNAPIVEVVRQMLYPYLKPDCSVKFNISGSYLTYSVAEIGSPIVSTVSWSITKKSDPVMSSSMTNLVSPWGGHVVGGIGLTTISSPPYYTGNTSSLTPGIINNVDGNYTIRYELSVTDSGVSNYGLDSLSTPTGLSSSSIVKSSADLDLVYPIFYGTSTYSAGGSSVDEDVAVLSPNLKNNIIPNLSKFISRKGDTNISLSGTGYIYFMYPSIFGSLSQIKDQNGFVLYDQSSGITASSFIEVYQRSDGLPMTPQVYPVISSPNSYWSNNTYAIYRSRLYCTVVPSITKWEFKFV